METMVSISNLLSGFPLPPVRTVTYSASTSSRISSFSATPASKMKKKLLFRPQQSPRDFLGFGFRSYSSRKLAINCGFVSEINESQFSEVVLKSDRPVLVEFVATWCGPCRLISLIVDRVAEEYQERLSVVKIDHDSNPQLIKKYKVYGLPALILFKNGKEVPNSRREGAISKAKLKDYLDALLESVSVP